MPSTELDDLMVMAEWISERTDPVGYTICPISHPSDVLISHEPIFKVIRTKGYYGSPLEPVFAGTEERVRCYLNGISEGRCAALRRW